MKSLSLSTASRGARALAGAVAALLLAAGGATAATPDHAWHHGGRGHESWDRHHRRLRHRFPRRGHHRHPVRHIGVWHRPVR